MKTIFASRFKMKDLGPISTILGVRVRRDRANKKLWIDQSHYIKDVLKEFQYTDCKPVSTPADGYEYLQPATTKDSLFIDIPKY